MSEVPLKRRSLLPRCRVKLAHTSQSKPDSRHISQSKPVKEATQCGTDPKATRREGLCWLRRDARRLGFRILGFRIDVQIDR